MVRHRMREQGISSGICKCIKELGRIWRLLYPLFLCTDSCREVMSFKRCAGCAESRVKTFPIQSGRSIQEDGLDALCNKKEEK